MKIQIRNKEHAFTIPIPTGLIFSDFTAWMVGTVGRKYASDALKDIPQDALKRLFQEFRRIKRKHKKWTLVEVHSADGEHILIQL